MPFVTINQISTLVRPSILKVLQQEGMFAQMEAQAARKVRDITGIAIPETADAPPDWVILPMAWFISKYASPHVPSPSDNFYQQIDADYAKGEREIAAHRTKPTTTANAISGVYPIEGELSW